MKRFFYVILFILYAYPLYAWDQGDKLVAIDGAVNDNFGYSVSISGDYAVVGSYKDDDSGGGSGSAYVFVREGEEWTEQSKLLASDGAANDNFGYSVSISGDYAVIGSYNDDDVGSNSGSVYVFVREGEEWTEQSKLLASDGAANDNFGYSVSISGDYAIVGAYKDDDLGNSSGSAYVFVREGEDWTEQEKLLASDGAGNDNFGYSVSISGNYAVIGAYNDDDVGSNSGSAYVFVREGEDWTEQEKLLASDGAANDNFGYSVSISGDYAIVGSYKDDDSGGGSGSAYVFVREWEDWTEQEKLLASDGAGNDSFGYSVVVSGDYAVIGAYNDDDVGSNSGSAYVFVREGEAWTEQEKLLAEDGAANDNFGYSVSVSENFVLIGAFNEDDMGSNSGSAYIYNRNTIPEIEAGEDQNDIYENSIIAFSGACSDDNLDDTLTGLWTQISGTSCGDIDGTPDIAVGGGSLLAEATCVAPDVLENETLVFRLTCNDGTDIVTEDINVLINAKPVAIPQGLETDEDVALEITLAGLDPDDEELTYIVVSAPTHGLLTGVAPNLIYTPETNYNGADSFTFRVVDEVLQTSDIVTVSISVSSENDLPIIYESEDDLLVVCSVSEDCDLPSWEVEDPDGDVVSLSWREVGGEVLHFTDDNKIDLINYLVPRNTYYIQLIAEDGVAATASSVVEVNIPNHMPVLVDIDVVEALTYESGVYRLNSFSGFVNIQSEFSDQDNDILSYQWEVIQGSAGFSSTIGGNAVLRLRNVGTTIIRLTVEDGFGGSYIELLNVFQPLPEFDPIITITSYELLDDFTQKISGEIKSPIEPILVVNDVLADIVFSESTLLDINKTGSSKELSMNLFESYLFTVLDVPIGEDSESLSLKVLTLLDGENVHIATQSILISNIKTIEEGSIETGNEAGNDSGSAISYGFQGGGLGCQINTAIKASKACYWWFIFLLSLIIFIKRFFIQQYHRHS